MRELRERFFERLNNFKKNSYNISNELLSYRYGELYGLLDSMRILDIISNDEYSHLLNELNTIYYNILQ